MKATYSYLASYLIGGGGWSGATYETLTPLDGQVKPSLEALEAVREAAEAAMNAPSAADVRATKRAELLAQWDGLPSWIRGPYRAAFYAANALLDEGDDEAAAELIAYQSAPYGYDVDQVAMFANVKEAFANGIADLS